MEVVLLLLIILILLGSLFARRKAIYQWFSNGMFRDRDLEEDLLKQIYLAESTNQEATSAGLAGLIGKNLTKVERALERLAQRKLVNFHGGVYSLSSPGQQAAISVLRAHRLWERFLADETGFPETEWHARAERLEHKIPETELNLLSARLGNPAYDPHGDPIPTAQGELPDGSGQPIFELEAGMAAKVVHLEDEPEEIYQRLREQNLSIGSELFLLEVGVRELVIWTDGAEVVLNQDEVNNIFVVPISNWDFRDRLPGERLSLLRPGESGIVHRISPILRGQERRRLMDLGIVPGTLIQTEFESPSGEPVAYDVRGALIALRKEQTDHIRVHRSLA